MGTYKKLFFVFLSISCSNFLLGRPLEQVQRLVQEQLMESPDRLNLSIAVVGPLTQSDVTVLLNQLLPEQKMAVTWLLLNGQQLTEVPRAIFVLPMLVRLELNFNQLNRLPDEIDSLSHLQRLELQHNHILGLPSTMRHLAHLSVLNLAGNELEFVPEAVWRLTNLRILRLDDNVLPRISAKIRRLHHLEELQLDRNNLQWLPDEIVHLQHLQSLVVSNNILLGLPGGLGHLATHLQVLNVSGNQPPFSVNYQTHVRALLPHTSVTFERIF